MKCEKVQKNLSAYVDREVDSRLRQRMEQHLAECPVCAAERKRIEKVAEVASSSVRAWASDKEVPTGFREGVMEHLERRTTPRMIAMPFRRFAMVTALSVLVAAMVVTLILESSFRLQRQALQDEVSECRAALKVGREERDSAKTDLAAAQATLGVVEDKLRLAERQIDEAERLAAQTPGGERYAWRPVVSSLQMPGARGLLENGVF